MIKFRFKSEKKTEEVLIPSNWSEVKVKHYKRLEEEGPELDYEVLACFTDFDFSTIANATSKDDLFVIAEVMAFLNDKTPLEKIKKKKQVYLRDKWIKPPTEVRLETIGQKSLAKPILAKYTEKKDPAINDIIDLCAIYFQPAYSGKFDANKIEGVKHYIMEMPVMDVIPWFLFFFRKLSLMKGFGLIGFKASLKTLRKLFYMSRRGVLNLTPSAN